MPVVVLNSEISPAQLFKRTREALGMSVNDMQDALCLMDRENVLRIERGSMEVFGVTWVALSYMIQARLDEIEDGEAEGDPEELENLYNQILVFTEAIQRAARARREERQARRDQREEGSRSD